MCLHYCLLSFLCLSLSTCLLFANFDGGSEYCHSISRFVNQSCGQVCDRQLFVVVLRDVMHNVHLQVE